MVLQSLDLFIYLFQVGTFQTYEWTHEGHLGSCLNADSKSARLEILHLISYQWSPCCSPCFESRALTQMKEKIMLSAHGEHLIHSVHGNQLLTP